MAQKSSPGHRTDFICTRRAWTERKQTLSGWTGEVWLVQGELYELCYSALQKFSPRIGKPSTGLCAVIIARHFFPDEDIGVTGFDYTLHPETTERGWLHDAYAECRCLRSLDITEI